MSNKNKHIQIRVTEEEKEMIEKLANEKNLKVSEFLKFAVMKVIIENERCIIEGEKNEGWNENSKY